MASKLVTIAVLGLVTSAVCMGAAAAIGGGSLGDGIESWFENGPRCHKIDGATATSRDMDWDGSDKVQLVVFSDASYTPGTDDKLHASGDPQVLAQLKIHNGKIDLDCHGWRDRDKITLTLPGREFREFAIAGRSDLKLNRMNQSSLKAKIAGTGTIKADGRIDDLNIDVAGIGHADFGKVTSKSANVKLAGVASADIAPTESAKIKIAGPGGLHKLGPNG